MDSPSLARQGSTVPVSTHQVESTVIPIPIDKAWNVFKHMQLEKTMPNKIKSVEWVTGAPNQLDSVVSISYTDGAKWELRIHEISDVRYTLGYQVLSTEPAHQVTSIQGQIHLRPVTDDNSTYVQWTTDFSNDADATVIFDQKYKKREFFAEMKATLAARK